MLSSLFLVYLCIVSYVLGNLHDFDMDENLFHKVNSCYYDINGFSIMPQLYKCLKVKGFQGVILYRIQSLLFHE